MLRKKLVAVLTALAFMLTLVPSVALADPADPGTGTDPAEQTEGSESETQNGNEEEAPKTFSLEAEIENFDDSDKDVVVTFKGKDGDTLQRERDVVEFSIGQTMTPYTTQYDDNGKAVFPRSEVEGANPLKDEVLTVRVIRDSYIAYTPLEFTAKYKILNEDEDEDEDDAYHGPRYLEFYTNNVEADSNDQKITVEFNEGYSPKKNDEVRLLAYDKDGKRLRDGDSKRANMKDDNYREDGKKRIDFYVDVPNDADYYRIEYYDSTNAKYHYHDTLSVKGSHADYTKLVLDYDGNEVVIGEEVTPKIYLETEDGFRKEVKKDATIAFSGDLDAIESSDKRNGKFRVKDDVKYVGKQITVTASVGKHSTTEKLMVVEKKENSKATAPAEKHAVIMIINSKDLFINNKKESIDAIPVIKHDRTFVPYRALAESFGAQVNYNDAARAVTVTYDDKVIVMTVGQKGYTVNGEPKVMDVEPYIANDRTMVPVRFVAEAMGFQVEALFNLDGTTANVVFKNY